ncbi:hypothetical protein D3C73_702090 [compost metagenome]|jgi:hypothetical protein
MTVIWLMIDMAMDDKNKRRVSFISGEDFYYITYLSLLTIYQLAPRGSGVFKDHRKISFIAQIISKNTIINTLMRYKNTEIVNVDDKDFIFSCFNKGFLHQRDTLKILRSLEKKGVISLMRTAQPEVFDVFIDIKKNKAFFESLFPVNLFDNEINNLFKFKELNPTVNRTGLDRFIGMVFKNCGVEL